MLLLKLTQEALQCAALSGAQVSIADDPWHCMELLQVGPGQLRIVVLYEGEDTTGDNPHIHGVCAVKLRVIVSRGRGLALPRGESKVGAADNTGLADWARTVRDTLRNSILNGGQFRSNWRYQGTETLEAPERLAWDAYALRFEVLEAN